MLSVGLSATGASAQSVTDEMIECLKDSGRDNGFTETLDVWTAGSDEFPNLQGSIGILNPITDDYMTTYIETGAQSADAHGWVHVSVEGGDGSYSSIKHSFREASEFGGKNGTNHDIEGVSASNALPSILRCLGQKPK